MPGIKGWCRWTSTDTAELYVRSPGQVCLEGVVLPLPPGTSPLSDAGTCVPYHFELLWPAALKQAKGDGVTVSRNPRASKRRVL